mgnify:CR=1 FL=1
MSITSLLPWKREKKAEVTRQRADDPLRTLQQDMNQWFDAFFSRDFGLAPLWSEGSWSAFVPTVDVTESDDEVTVTADLPGLEEKDIELQVEGNALLIRGEREQRKETRDRSVYRSERSYGRFHRSVALPIEVESEKASAVYKNGVLTVKLPKEAPTKRKKISVSHT